MNTSRYEPDLLRIFSNSNDLIRLRRLRDWFSGHVVTLETIIDSMERSVALAAERATHFAAWHAQQKPRRDLRNAKILRLHRRGFSPCEIGRHRDVQLTERQVRRILKKQLRLVTAPRRRPAPAAADNVTTRAA